MSIPAAVGAHGLFTDGGNAIRYRLCVRRAINSPPGVCLEPVTCGAGSHDVMICPHFEREQAGVHTGDISG